MSTLPVLKAAQLGAAPEPYGPTCGDGASTSIHLGALGPDVAQVDEYDQLFEFTLPPALCDSHYSSWPPVADTAKHEQVESLAEMESVRRLSSRF